MIAEPPPPPAKNSPPRVIGPRPRKSLRLVPLLFISIAIHVLIALGLALVLSRHFAVQEIPVDLGMDVTIGEPVQELIVAADTPTAPAAEATPPPPPPEPPPPEPPAEPPPVMDKPEFVEPAPAPKPPPAPKREAAPKAPPKPATAPPGAKVGPKPQAGVVGGNVTQGATTGTPGGSKIGTWKFPRPSYPAAALVSHLQASGNVRVTTDAAGNISSCEVSGLAAPFDSNTRSFVRSNWKGPPNSTRSFPVIYRLQ